MQTDTDMTRIPTLTFHTHTHTQAGKYTHAHYLHTHCGNTGRAGGHGTYTDTTTSILSLTFHAHSHAYLHAPTFRAGRAGRHTQTQQQAYLCTHLSRWEGRRTWDIRADITGSWKCGSDQSTSARVTSMTDTTPVW